MERAVPRAEIRGSEWGDRPKEAVAAYVESQGFLVPRRYDFRQAKQILQGGGAVLARSEHPDEANGPSGLLLSTYMSEPDDQHSGPRVYLLSAETQDAFRERMNSQFQPSRQLSFYCKLAGHELEAYAGATDYSFWEPVRGANIGLVRGGEGEYTLSYKEAGSDTQLIAYSQTSGAQFLGLHTEYRGPMDVERVVAYCDDLYALDRFSAKRGKFELQLGSDGQIYFLQWHEIASRALPLPARHGDVSGLHGMECTYRGAMPENGFTIECLDQFPYSEPSPAYISHFGRSITDGAGYMGIVRGMGVGEFIAHYAPVHVHFWDTQPSEWKNWDHTRDSLLYTPPLKLSVPEFEDEQVYRRYGQELTIAGYTAHGESTHVLRRLRLSVIPDDSVRATVFVHPPEQKSEVPLNSDSI